MVSDAGPVEQLVDLHSEIYSRSAVDAAAAAFSHVADVTVESAPPYLRVRLRSRSEVASLRDEFANYVLAVVAVARGAASEASPPNGT